MKVVRLTTNIREIVKDIVKVLNEGGLVVIPTDTSYGIAADALNSSAVRRVFEVKRRPLQKPLSVFLGSVNRVKELCITDELVERALKLLPGRVTLIVKAKNPEAFPQGIVGPNNSIGIRVSPHPLPTLIAKELGRPITATSANISGEPPIYDSREIIDKLTDIDLLVDGGVLPRTPVSTIIDLTKRPPKILRVGPVSKKEVETVLRMTIII